MKVTLGQAELDQAILDYVRKMGVSRPIDDMQFTAGRRGNGITVEIDIRPDDTEVELGEPTELSESIESAKPSQVDWDSVEPLEADEEQTAETPPWGEESASSPEPAPRLFNDVQVEAPVKPEVTPQATFVPQAETTEVKPGTAGSIFASATGNVSADVKPEQDILFR